MEIFDLIEPFAGYAFNKAHSVSYALISYWTGYFKTHYPVEYMAAVLNSRMDNTEKMVSSINECFRLGIPVLLRTSTIRANSSRSTRATRATQATQTTKIMPTRLRASRRRSASGSAWLQ